MTDWINYGSQQHSKVSAGSGLSMRNLELERLRKLSISHNGDQMHVCFKSLTSFIMASGDEEIEVIAFCISFIMLTDIFG